VNKRLKKILPILALIVIVIVTVFSITGASASNSFHAAKPEGIKDSDGLLFDAKMCSQHWNVTVDEALRRFKLEDSARVLEAKLWERESATFGGLWIQNTPEFKIVAAFSGDAAKTIASYVTPEISDVIEARSVKYSYNELQAIRNEFQSSLKDLGIEFNSATNVMENNIDIDIVAKDKSRVDNGITGNKLKMSDQIKINVVNGLSKPELDIYGGRALVGLYNCTSGFAVMDYTGCKGNTTAGHADDFLLFYTFPLPWQNELRTGSYDVEWHTCPGLTVVNKFQYWENGSTLDVTATQTRSFQLIGETVSKYGNSTHYTAGIISAKDAYVSVPNCLPTWIKIYNAFGYSDLSAPGDSGGPWFRGNTAYGIHQGGDPDNNYAYYMAVNYITGLGVSVMTSP
jgi:hypothetical protein